MNTSSAATFISLLLLYLLTSTIAQTAPPIPLLHPQSDIWNSSLSASSINVTGTGITSSNQTADIALTLNFERSNWAFSSIAEDAFYTSVPTNSSSLPPGSILKIESFTNTTTYTLPPNVALSRIMYTTQTLRNTSVPASAFVLWPYLPLSATEYPNLTAPNPNVNSSKFPVVVWAHGTSGVFGECGPSHIRNLWYQYSAPFTAALAGYVVVGVDYQGLGVNASANGTPIQHPLQASVGLANDLVYAVQAAQAAFPSKLSKEFVVMGHSEGGGAAWGVAQREVSQPTSGYLGTIAGSPTTNLSGEIALLASVVPPILGFSWAESVRNLYPDFNQSRILTDGGLERLRLAKDWGMCNSAIGALFADYPGTDNGTILHTGWNELPEIMDFLSLCDVGGSRVQGPMLVLQGTLDPNVPAIFTDASVAETCAIMVNETQWGGLQYARFDGVTHVPVLFAAQRLWLDWLAQRFASIGGIASASTCTITNYTSTAMPVTNYQAELGYFLELATQAYQVA